MTYTAPSFPLPTIHLNGTGRDRLLADYHTAHKLLNAAADAFASVEFNARDYYVQGDRKSTRLNSSHVSESRMPSSA